MRWKNLLSAGILFGLFALLAVTCIDWEACAGWFYTLPKGIREAAFVLANAVQIVLRFCRESRWNWRPVIFSGRKWEL